MILLYPICEYAKRVAAHLLNTGPEPLRRIVEKIASTKPMNTRIYTAGNGGGVSAASHFYNELLTGCRIDGWLGFSAHCLCDAMPVLTCRNSPKILRAARYAQARGIFLNRYNTQRG